MYTCTHTSIHICTHMYPPHIYIHTYAHTKVAPPPRTATHCTPAPFTHTHSPQSAAANLLMGGAAGTIAATVCYPLDTIRRRMQVRPPASTSQCRQLGPCRVYTIPYTPCAGFIPYTPYVLLWITTAFMLFVYAMGAHSTKYEQQHLRPVLPPASPAATNATALPSESPPSSTHTAMPCPARAPWHCMCARVLL